jgi:hypothetical protein
MPGAAIGKAWLRGMPPELPNEHASPGGKRSMMVTSCPSRRSATAEARPITPAPITATRRGFVLTMPLIIDVRILFTLIRSDETISST